MLSASDVVGTFDWAYVFSAVMLVLGYVYNIISNQVFKYFAEKRQRLEAQVLCLGRISHAFKMSQASIDDYRDNYMAAGDRFCDELATKHLKDWYTEAKATHGRIFGERDQTPVHTAFRQLSDCPNIPPAFHIEITENFAMKMWFKHVRGTIIPCNADVEQQLLENRHILPKDDAFNGLLDRFCAYSAAYRRMVHLWDEGDYTLTMVSSRFPEDLPKLVDENLRENMDYLEHGLLLGSCKRRISRCSSCYPKRSTSKDKVPNGSQHVACQPSESHHGVSGLCSSVRAYSGTMLHESDKAPRSLEVQSWQPSPSGRIIPSDSLPSQRHAKEGRKARTGSRDRRSGKGHRHANSEMNSNPSQGMLECGEDCLPVGHV